MNIISTHGVQFQNGMPVVNGSQRVTSTSTLLNTTHPAHMQVKTNAPSNNSELDPAKGFAAALNQALSGVEKLDQNTQELTMKAVYDPDSVDAHTLMIAAEKSRFALTLTKTVADGLVRGFRELTSAR